VFIKVYVINQHLLMRNVMHFLALIEFVITITYLTT